MAEVAVFEGGSDGEEFNFTTKDTKITKVKKIEKRKRRPGLSLKR